MGFFGFMVSFKKRSICQEALRQIFRSCVLPGLWHLTVFIKKNVVVLRLLLYVRDIYVSVIPL